MTLPIVKMATLSKTRDQLRIFNPVVKGLRCVTAKRDRKNDISNIIPKMRPAIDGTVEEKVV
jgi:hypothetical protein